MGIWRYSALGFVYLAAVGIAIAIAIGGSVEHHVTIGITLAVLETLALIAVYVIWAPRFRHGRRLQTTRTNQPDQPGS